MPARPWWQVGLARCLVASLAALLVGVAVGAPAAGGHAASGNAAAFDQLALKLDRGEVRPSTTADAQRVMAKLKSELPPGDVRRELRYRYLNCFLGLDVTPAVRKAYAERGLADAQRAGYIEGQVNFLFCMGTSQEALTSARDALPDYDAAIALARKTENAQLLADGLTWRGSARSLLGDYARSVVDLLEAQRFYASAGQVDGQEQNLQNIAIAYRRLGEYAKARGYLDKLMADATRDHDLVEQMSLYMEYGYGDLYADRQHAAEARTAFQQVLALGKQVKAPGLVASAHLALVQVDNRVGAYQAALDTLTTTASELKTLGDSSNQGMIDLQTGIAHAGLGKLGLAILDFDRAEDKLRDSGNLRYYEDLLKARSKTYAAMGNAGQALLDLQHAMQVHDTLDQRARSDTSTLMSYQFDVTQRDEENRKLTAERKLQSAQLASLENIRRWQQVAMALGALLILLLFWLAYRQVHAARRLRQMADTDPLTGIANRRSTEWQGLRLFEQAANQGGRLAVLMLDIDHFKRINDDFGHQAGDAVLQQVAQVCHAALREGDVIGRIGGEEFVVLLPGVAQAKAMEIAERLRAVVAAIDLAAVTPGRSATMSVGCAMRSVRDRGFGNLLDRADRAMYRAKAAGRNQVMLAGEDEAQAPPHGAVA